MFSLLKQKLEEDILDLAFFSSKEVLENAFSLLTQLLSEEKEKFYQKLTLQDQEINFENLEDESLLSTFFWLIEHLNSVESNENLRKIIEDFEPLYVEWSNEISYSKSYFELLLKIKAKGWLNPDQSRIIDESIKNYRIRWIDLDQEKQTTLKDINTQIASLQQSFSNNIIDSEAEFSFLIEDVSILQEMPQDDKEVALSKAKNQSKEAYLFDASWWSYASIMSYCSDTKIREHFYKTKNQFASSGKYDNRQIILDILTLRSQKASLLGYNNYAEYSFEHKMAESPKKVINLIKEVASKAKRKWQEEIETLKSYFWLDTLDYWDISYYTRKYKEEVFSYDEKQLKQYFELDTTIAGMFQLASHLFWVEFSPVSNFESKKYHPDTQLFAVKKDGQLKAYLLCDYFYRKGKRPWAWANNLRSKYFHHGKNKLPLVVNVGNFQKSTSEKTLLPLRDVETLFHEFGHALHEMLSESTYAELSGFWVELDFVELPSQLMENWCSDKTSLDLFARHITQWNTVPEDMLIALKKSENFWKWNFLLRQNEFAYLDMMLCTEEVPDNIWELDSRVIQYINEISLTPKYEGYKMYTTFSHLFDGWYAAGYYSYMWSEIIEAQIWEIFEWAWSLNQEIWQRYYDIVLAQWSRKDGIDIFKEFSWKDIDIWSFLKRYEIS